jgi:hypothetical protein
MFCAYDVLWIAIELPLVQDKLFVVIYSCHLTVICGNGSGRVAYFDSKEFPGPRLFKGRKFIVEKHGTNGTPVW